MALGAAGCTTDSVLNLRRASEPQAPVPDAMVADTTTPDQLAPAEPAQTEPAPAAPTQAAIATDESVQFAPVIGASADLLPPLSRRLQERARQAGIAVAGRNGRSSLVMKGYFSAISDGGRTTVVYVWDVLDPSGNRLHRIQGQQATPGGSGDGWSSVTPAVMEAVADATISQLAGWLAQRKG